MEYGSQGIQPEGRVIEIREEVSIEPGEHSQGQGRKVGKNTNWKYRSVCQNCGAEFAGRVGAANRFCRNECQHEFAVNRWLPCSKCMAAAGIGTKTTAKLLGINDSTVAIGWKKRGIKPTKPNGLTIVQASRMKIKRELGKPKREEQEALKAYRMARMRDIRECARGFDWSCLWSRELSNLTNLNRYHQLTHEEKIERTRKRKERLIQKLGLDGYKKHVAEKRKKWKLDNPDLHKKRQKKYLSRIPIEIRRKKSRDADKKRMKEDVAYRARQNLRSRFKMLMKTAKAGGAESFSKTIGCTTKHLRLHLESQFSKSMMWANYGTHWHIDHIMPCASFDHTDPKQVAQCWHWTNLRPLEAKENIAKGARITNPQMHLLLCPTR